METGEQQHRTDIVWLSSVMRIDAKTIGYIGSGEDNGYCILDVETMQVRIADFEFHESDTFDFRTFAQVDEGVDADGETVYMLYTYFLDSPEEKTVLLTVKSDFMRVWAVTESYIICMYNDGSNHEERGFVVVPY